MAENLENQVVISGPHHPFSDEEELDRERKRTEELRPVLDELERHRAESLYGRLAIYGCAA